MKSICKNCRKFRPERKDSNCRKFELFSAMCLLSEVAIEIAHCKEFTKDTSEKVCTQFNDRNYFC